MSSSVVEYASQGSNKNNSQEDADELLPVNCDPKASNLSLPSDVFLRAAISIKDQVFILLLLSNLHELVSSTHFHRLSTNKFECEVGMISLIMRKQGISWSVFVCFYSL